MVYLSFPYLSGRRVYSQANSTGNHGPRLVDGENRSPGRVEVLHESQWGMLCGDSFGLKDASVVREHLQCGLVKSIYRAFRSWKGDGLVWKENYRCRGEHFQLRLSDGGSPCAGRVEIYYKGTWGSVCDDSWDFVDAEVGCEQLGCGSALDMTFPSSYGAGSCPVWLKDVKCSGNEAFLWECPSAQLGHQDDCSHKEDVRIVCSENKEMRLVNGKHRCEGRVEVFYNGTWGTVCSKSLDFRDAEVICKQLHCGGVQDVMYETASFGTGQGQIRLDGIECQSHESTLWQCRTNPWDQHDCEHRDDAGVVCSGNMAKLLNVQLSFQILISNRVSMFLLLTESNVTQEQPLSSSSCNQRSDSQLSVRLDGGSSNCSGRVEIKCDGRWGTLCGDSWDIVDANVVCRQLRCGFALLTAHDTPEQLIDCRTVSLSFTETFARCFNYLFSATNHDSSIVPSTDLSMVGKGSSLGLYQGIYDEIENNPPGKMILQEFEPVVSASIDSLNHIEYYTSHNLIDKNRGTEDPEVNSNSIAGPIRRDYDDILSEEAESQDDLSQLDSDVDEHLTLTNAGLEVHSLVRSHCIPAAGKMFVSLVKLLLLQLLNWRRVYSQADSAETVRLRLVNGGSPCAGRVEIHYMGVWGTVHQSEWDEKDANVVCRELECGNAVSALGNAHFGKGSGPIVTIYVQCRGDERALRECQSAGWGHYSSSHDNDAGVICSEHRAPRLVPENSQCSGRLEVQIVDTWKTVCGLDWDLKNANVVCAQLRCGVAVSVSSSAHSGGSTLLLANEVFKCAGNETHLGKCPRASSTHQGCSGHKNVTLICSGNHGPRLVDGENRCSGRVEVLHENQWGTLCGDSFGLQDASVVCEHLQCGAVKSIPREFRSGKGGGPVWKESYSCRGDERRLWDCPVSHGENFMCSREKVAHVVCSDENWALRLVNGGSHCDGRVEVYYNGSWGGLQDSRWDRNNAAVFCRQLGCGYALETYNFSKYGETDSRSWLLGVQCHGQEPHLQNCRFDTFNWSSSDSSGVGVICSEHLQLRLSDGGSPCAGRVEIYYKGTWGSVCDDSWDVVDAEVVCKQLGCGNALDMTFPSSYGAGSGPVWLKDVKCSGNESFLWECPSAHLGYQEDCSHKEDVRIVCSEHKEMRLVNGKHRCEGRVEVFYNGTWGTVCSKSLEFHDAEVICKQLRCGTVQDVMYDTASFGAGQGQIRLDGIECQSHESTLWQCRTNPWDQHDCEHRDDAGVVCSETSVTQEQPLSSSSCNQRSDSQLSVRLDGGSSNCSGRVEIECDGRWGTLCGDSWDIVDANVVCRQLRCGFTLPAQGGTAVSLGGGVIWQNDVKCKGSESSLSDCLSPAPAQRKCNQKEIAHVICSGPDVLTTSPSPPPTGQGSPSISIPVVVCLTLGVLFICDLVALLVVMQRKSQMKDLYTVGKASSLGLYQGIYEEIENIPPGKVMLQELEPVTSASINSLNHIEYYTSHNLIDNNRGSENPEVNSNSIAGPIRGYYDDIETEGAESQDSQFQLDSDPDELRILTNDASNLCSHGK
ncbi:deleted in malignant brain tumors 1 protein-like [Stegostoma tigrinum]|uniref:deleted in malignant brain tumors 1 protein-like n=1 Tax=Stegostoma tigrinum TaxID=3053191 RepID=UPI0028705B80|nr:deleted in malignant brain tumors 1 protein-like [Stegostoma tigrinum]